MIRLQEWSGPGTHQLRGDPIGVQLAKVQAAESRADPVWIDQWIDAPLDRIQWLDDVRVAHVDAMSHYRTQVAWHRGTPLEAIEEARNMRRLCDVVEMCVQTLRLRRHELEARVVYWSQGGLDAGAGLRAVKRGDLARLQGLLATLDAEGDDRLEATVERARAKARATIAASERPPGAHFSEAA